MKRRLFRESALLTLTCAGVLLSSSAFAQSASIQDAMTECSKVSNSLQRLVCYDRLAKSMRQYSGLEQSVSTVSRQPSVPVTVPRTPVPDREPVTPSQTAQPQASAPTVAVPTAEQEFGLEHKRDTDEMISRINATVTEISTNQFRKRLITLENGQKWRQQDGSTLKISVGDRVYVERGALGSFYLSNDKVNKRMKVKRVN